MSTKHSVVWYFLRVFQYKIMPLLNGLFFFKFIVRRNEWLIGFVGILLRTYLKIEAPTECRLLGRAPHNASMRTERWAHAADWLNNGIICVRGVALSSVWHCPKKIINQAPQCYTWWVTLANEKLNILIKRPLQAFVWEFI